MLTANPSPLTAIFPRYFGTMFCMKNGIVPGENYAACGRSPGRIPLGP